MGLAVRNASGRAGKVGGGDGPCCSNAAGRAGKVGSGDGPCRSNAAGGCINGEFGVGRD